MKINYDKFGVIGEKEKYLKMRGGNINNAARFILFISPETPKEAVDMEWCLNNFKIKSIQRTMSENPTYSISFEEK